jgi:predicted MFS family arabinose efflux permease
MTSSVPAVMLPARLSQAARATYMVFAACGFTLATFVSRIPQLRDNLKLSAAQLGIVLLTAAAGSLISRLFSQPVVTRLGQRGTVTVASITAAGGVVGVGLSDFAGLTALIVGLLLLGLAASVWDVAMNVQAATVERALGRSAMSRFHAAFSVGTVAGALVGVAMVAGGVPVATHMVFASFVTGLSVPIAARHYLPDRHGWAPEDHAAARTDGGRRAGPSAWREPRTWLIGLFVLAFAFGEGAANDWISIALIDGYHTRAVLGTIAFTTFLVAVTTARWFGSGLLNTYGRVTVLRVSGVIVIVGLLLFIFGPNLIVAFAGIVLWGVGIAFGYPVGISAGSDDPVHAVGRVTVISTIGKFATFAGPPLIGLLGDHLTVLRALLVVAALQGVAVMIASATRPLPALVGLPEDHVADAEAVR